VPAAADEQWSDFHHFWMDGIVKARLIVNVNPKVPPSVMAPLLFAPVPPRCPAAGSKIGTADQDSVKSRSATKPRY
jgi:hypothetical protein